MRSGGRSDGSLVVASYNVHGWVGSDGRYDPGRVGRVMCELAPDLLALQEVRCPHGDRLLLERLAEPLGAQVVRGITLQLHEAAQGNAMLSRLPFGHVEHFDLSQPGREPRAAIDATIPTQGEPLRVVATHLGIGAAERRRQVRHLLGRLEAATPGVLVVLGDMNEWVRGVGALLPLHRRLGRAPGPRTFPAPFPLFSLDRIWVAPRQRLRRVWVHQSALARRASDHLPVLAELALDVSGEGPWSRPVPGGLVDRGAHDAAPGRVPVSAKAAPR